MNNRENNKQNAFKLLDSEIQQKIIFGKERAEYGTRHIDNTIIVKEQTLLFVNY